MAYDGWIEFDGTEIINISRTAQLAEALGVGAVRTRPSQVQWIQTALGGTGYGDITKAPWYDAGVPASAEFIGFMPFGILGMEDSSASSPTTEYVGNGGSTGVTRNATLPMVANGAFVATTERGAEYGKRWMTRRLQGAYADRGRAGKTLRCFRYGAAGSDIVRRRKVKTTRGLSITGKRRNDLESLWLATFTMTAGDPFEYSAPMPQIAGLGGGDGTVTGPGRLSDGVEPFITWASCPEWDFSPIEDPLHPTLLAGPEVPEFYPAGWNLGPGIALWRAWARIKPVEPSLLDIVPMFRLTTTNVARRVVLSIFPASANVEEQCDPLFSVVVNYLPAGGTMYVDSEEEAVYFWDGSGAVNRADGVAFNKRGGPVDWTAFNDPDGLLVTLDLPWVTGATPASVEGGGTVRVALDFVARSD